MTDFRSFPKIPRLENETITISEKIDGTNGLIWISEDLSEVKAGSRHQWISIEQDNFGFAKWVKDNEEELKKLGKGYHYGEWYGQGIQRNYGLKERHFALFNIDRWADDTVRPNCCKVVPYLDNRPFDASFVDWLRLIVLDLLDNGSQVNQGFMNSEGLILQFNRTGQRYKIILNGGKK